MPKYLNAADYMAKYNEAQLNDGIDPASLRYTQEELMQPAVEKIRHVIPDNDFYSDDYIKDYTTGAKCICRCIRVVTKIRVIM